LIELLEIYGDNTPLMLLNALKALKAYAKRDDSKTKTTLLYNTGYVQQNTVIASHCLFRGKYNKIFLCSFSLPQRLCATQMPKFTATKQTTGQSNL